MYFFNSFNKKLFDSMNREYFLKWTDTLNYTYKAKTFGQQQISGSLFIQDHVIVFLLCVMKSTILEGVFEESKHFLFYSPEDLKKYSIGFINEITYFPEGICTKFLHINTGFERENHYESLESHSWVWTCSYQSPAVLLFF